MSGHLRNDNECQNCGYTVDVAYCSNCGQKNTETRQPFHHLFTHFIEDLTHYDGAFWKTIKHLLFRPAKLTKEYLSGKRQTYVPPVKLYIFISFVTFFLLSFLANVQSNTTPQTNVNKTTFETIENDVTIKSVKDLDEYQKIASEEEKLPYIVYLATKATFNLREKNISPETKFKAIINMLPKVLFFYMPVFAFWLWLFHGKKRWYFFDHGIFTLHYFSFLLLNIAIVTILSYISYSISDDLGNLSMWFAFIAICYMFFYFFRAHRRMYGEKRWISRIKSFFLFWINFIFIFIFLAAGIIYAAAKL